MSLVTVAAALPAIEPAGKPFAHVDLDIETLGESFDQIRKAGQRLYLFLWKASGFGTREVRLTDGEIAEKCQRSRRWVQKALRQLLGHGTLLGRDPAEDAAPRIEKEHRKGPRHIAGRVLRIVLNFARPRDEDPKPAPRPRAKGKGAAAPAPAAPAPAAAPAPPPAAPEPEGPPLSPEQIRQEFARITGSARPGAPAPAGGGPRAAFGAGAPSDADTARRKAELEAQLEQLRSRRRPDGEEPEPKPRE